MPKVKIPSRLIRVLRPLGLGIPLSREALALSRSRLNTAVRLSNSPGRLAVIGCGVMGQTIARATRLLDGWTITALHDMFPEMAQRMQTSLAPQATLFDSLEALLENADLWDVLAIATTADSHVTVANTALKAGVRKIFLEKPIATSLADADALIETAENSGARIAIDHTRRWIPSGRGLRRLIDSGAIGPIRSLHFTFGRAGFAMIGTHLFDFTRWLFEADITKLSAELDDVMRSDRRGVRFIDQSGRCQALLSNGVRFTVDLSDDLALRQAFFVIFGERGRIEVDERLGRMRLIGYGGRVWEEGYSSLNAIELGVATALFELHTGKPPRCTPRDGRAALEAAIACQLSARDGNQWVSLPLNGDIYHEQFPFA